MEDDMGTNGNREEQEVTPPAEPVAPPPVPPVPPAPQPATPPTAPPPPPHYAAPPVGQSDKNKVAAGLLAILLGSLGVHKFYMGYTTEGIILLAVTVVSFGILSFIPWVIGIIEGIMYLTMTDEQWYATYIVNRKKWF